MYSTILLCSVLSLSGKHGDSYLHTSLGGLGTWGPVLNVFTGSLGIIEVVLAYSLGGLKAFVTEQLHTKNLVTLLVSSSGCTSLTMASNSARTIERPTWLVDFDKM